MAGGLAAARMLVDEGLSHLKKWNNFVF